MAKEADRLRKSIPGRWEPMLEIEVPFRLDELIPERLSECECECFDEIFSGTSLDWGSSRPRASRVLMMEFSFSESNSISRVVGVVAGRSLGESGSPQEDVKMDGPKAADMEAEGSVREPDR